MTVRGMWKMAFHQIYCFLLFSLCTSDIITSNFIVMTDMENLRLENDTNVIVSTSVVGCLIECANNLKCESVSYNSVTHICVFYHFLISSGASSLISEDGRKSYKHCRGRCSCPTHTGYVYNETLDWCYRLVEQEINTTQAVDFCRLDGARMLRITSLEKQLHVNNFLFSRDIHSVWIGGQSVNRDNIFVFEDGTPLLYFNWQGNNPDGKIYIRMKKEYHYSWENANGIYERAFMCEK